jgi:hypothetical protein
MSRRQGFARPSRTLLAVRWLAGALVVLAAAIVAAAVIVANSTPAVNVHIDGPVTVCHTVSLTVNTCR